MMHIREERLREAACVGDLAAVLSAINQRIDINSKNRVNGWTALHWAAKRNHHDIVRILISSGADKEAKTNCGRKPVDLTTEEEIIDILQEKPSKTPPPVDYDESSERISSPATDPPTRYTQSPTDPVSIILKVRVHGSFDPDFIEIEVKYLYLTYENLLNCCCSELDVQEIQVERLRKLPNTRLRNDGDVQRLEQYQELELVLKPSDLALFNSAGYRSGPSSQNDVIILS